MIITTLSIRILFKTVRSFPPVLPIVDIVIFILVVVWTFSASHRSVVVQIGHFVDRVATEVLWVFDSSDLVHIEGLITLRNGVP